MANSLYTKAKQAFIEGGISFGADTIKVGLVLNTYTPDLAAHQFYADITPGSNVIGVSQTLTSKTTTNGVASAADVTFPAVPPSGTNQITYLVIYKSTGNPATSPLIALIDTTSNASLPIASNGGDIGINWTNGPGNIFSLG